VVVVSLLAHLQVDLDVGIHFVYAFTGVWVFSVLVRFSYNVLAALGVSKWQGKASIIEMPHGATAIEVDVRGKGTWKAGQHVYLRLPGLNLFVSMIQPRWMMMTFPECRGHFVAVVPRLTSDSNPTPSPLPQPRPPIPLRRMPKKTHPLKSSDCSSRPVLVSHASSPAKPRAPSQSHRTPGCASSSKARMDTFPSVSRRSTKSCSLPVVWAGLIRGPLQSI
jgi:hypothetical protein